MQQRRRSILTGLALITGGSLTLGVVPPLRMLWLVTLVSGALLAGYCYLLVQLRTVAIEREMEHGFSVNHNRMPRPAPPVAEAYDDDSLLLHRSAS